ncbi:unnamed protein product [Boreogadus saida]
MRGGEEVIDKQDEEEEEEEEEEDEMEMEEEEQRERVMRVLRRTQRVRVRPFLLSHPGAKLAQSAPFHLPSLGFKLSDTLLPREGVGVSCTHGEQRTACTLWEEET